MQRGLGPGLPWDETLFMVILVSHFVLACIFAYMFEARLRVRASRMAEDCGSAST